MAKKPYSRFGREAQARLRRHFARQKKEQNEILFVWSERCEDKTVRNLIENAQGLVIDTFKNSDGDTVFETHFLPDYLELFLAALFENEDLYNYVHVSEEQPKGLFPCETDATYSYH